MRKSAPSESAKPRLGMANEFTGVAAAFCVVFGVVYAALQLRTVLWWDGEEKEGPSRGTLLASGRLPR